MNRAVVVVPIYKKEPSSEEVLSLQQSFRILGEYPFVFIYPKDLDITFYQQKFPHGEFWDFNKKFFKGFSGYNQLLLSYEFYARFSSYEWMLICQPDVFVFNNQLEDFCDLPYDYFGAPIAVFRNDRYMLYGGNGGFSLRRIEACRHVLLQYRQEVVSWRENEDEFFSYCGEKYGNMFRVAPIEIASSFAFDRFSRYIYELNHRELPFAVHGWYTRDTDFMAELIRPFLKGRFPNSSVLSAYEVLTEVRAFIQANQPILFWGAGEWGKCFLQYALIEKLNMEAFVVSDGQGLCEFAYRGKPIYHLGELPHPIQEYGVVVTVGREHTEQIQQILMNLGIHRIYVFSEPLCNAVGEYLLRCGK